MRTRIVSGITLTLLLLSMLTLAFNIQLVKSEPRTWTVDDDGPADFSTIQGAVYSASPGDTIYVKAGTYREPQVTINKPLQLIGENKNTTIVDGGGTWVCLYVQNTQNVTISGFTVQNGFGIYSWGSQNITINGNIIFDNEQGIVIGESTYITVSKNIVTQNGGVFLSDSNGSRILENNITLNNGDAIWLDNSHGNIIRENNISYNGLGTLPGYHHWGIRLDFSSSNNIIYHNNIVDNYEQATIWMAGNNLWDNGYPSGGNYWSDYEERYPDAQELDGSGIWDTPYVIDGNNQDNYPLVNPFTPTPPTPTTWTVDDDGPADFHTIQEAINAASNGDTIYVYNGTYHEHPIINKDDLIIVGENKNDTIIDGDGIGAVVRVTAVNVTISGFTVQNSGWRWYYDEGSGFYLGAGPKVIRLVNISDNIVSNCYFGISLSSSVHNTINGNTISNAGVGVSFFDSAYNNLGDNTISDIEYDGVVFWNPYYNNVTGNLITNCSGVGIRIRAGNENAIIGNTIIESDYGVLFYLSDHNVIQENNITGSEWNGIDLLNSSENTVTENNVANNRNGIVTQWAQNNFIYNNNFVENTFQVITYDSVNIWDNGYPSGGNYWSDYSGIDLYGGPYQNETGSDGIGDTPYIIDENNQDNYPLMEPWSPLEERKVGVKVGDWTLYQVNYTYSTNDPEPPLPRPPSEVFEIEQFRFFVQNVHETNVTFRFTTYYEDGTEETIERFIDVNTGEGIPVFIIGANLTADNIIYPDHWSEIRINETIPRRYLDVIRETNHYCRETSAYHDSYEENSSIHIYWDRATGFLTESMFETIVMDKTRNYTTYYLSSLQIVATNLWSPKPPSPIEATQELIETIETWNLTKGTENSLKTKLKVAIHMLDMGKEDGSIRKLTAFIIRVEMLREKTLTNEQADELVSEAQRIIDLITG